MRQNLQHPENLNTSPSAPGWALLLLVIIIAAALRFWELGELPPGLYRDEAYNGLDALGILNGDLALYFRANNGREPAYIYLTALFLPFLGRTALAIRVGAAVAGTVTTWATYQLATTWFNRRVGLLAAALWAVTLWPVHLSRIGLRAILLPLCLALAFWLAARAYRSEPFRANLWFLAGLTYGASFYTYLAARFTPLLLLLLLFYLLLTGRRHRVWPGIGWLAAGTGVAVIPLVILFAQQPELIFGRAGQVSIFNPAIAGGDPVGAIGRHTVRALGLFLIEGDTILRHNLAGRPLFDPLLAVPFLAGVVWCLRHWRRPPAAALLLWTTFMLGPTILAEDTPHFLRAAGILPAVLLFPALGLSQLWSWPKLPGGMRQGLVLTLVAGSLLLTVYDYFWRYRQSAEVAYLFESAARELAEQINNDLENQPAATVFVDTRFIDEYPSVRFLVREVPSNDQVSTRHELTRVVQFNPAAGLPEAPQPPFVVYLWPYGPRDFLAGVMEQPRETSELLLVSTAEGGLARGDLETAAYPLYVRYNFETVPGDTFGDTAVVNFDNRVQLRAATTFMLDDDRLQVDLYWSATAPIKEDIVAFIHVIGPDGIVGQSDARPAQGQWPWAWWQPGQIIYDRHTVALRDGYDPSRQQIIVGLYNASTLTRLPLYDATGAPSGDTWTIPP